MTDDRATGDGDTGDTRDTDDQVEALYEAVAATAERPVARPASAHLGEAEAVARDLVQRPADAATVRERAALVARLLREVGDTDDEVADEYVETALELAEALTAADEA